MINKQTAMAITATMGVLENHNHVYIIIELEIKQPTSLPYSPPLPFKLPFSLSIGYEPGSDIQSLHFSTLLTIVLEGSLDRQTDIQPLHLSILSTIPPISTDWRCI